MKEIDMTDEDDIVRQVGRHRQTGQTGKTG